MHREMIRNGYRRRHVLRVAQSVHLAAEPRRSCAHVLEVRAILHPNAPDEYVLFRAHFDLVCEGDIHPRASR